MKHEKLTDALSQIRDAHILEAITYKKRRLPQWVYPVAAVLALAILVGALWTPTKSKAPQQPTFTIDQVDNNHAPIDHGIQLQYLVATAQYPELCGYPLKTGDGSGYSDWREDQLAMHTQPEGYADSLTPFWQALTAQLLAGGEGNNVACSPVNIYMALAMLAEITDGESRQQILDALGADTIETLQKQAKDVWQGHYNDDGLSTSILANSLWMEENYGFNQETANFLAENYYASVFQGDLGTAEMNAVLQAWLDEQTGGLLKEQVSKAGLDPMTVLALASTIYYKVQWVDEFKELKNTEATFHTPTGNRNQVFMNRTLSYGPYYWSDNFGAVALSLEDGSTMWLVLPDEGVTPESIVSEFHVFLAQEPNHFNSGYQNQKDVQVNLSVPKFDVSAGLELENALKNMGITQVFEEGVADFSPILPQDDGGFISSVQHAARVAIDEKGVTAAAFTVIDRCGAAMPPEEEIDFVLDRPFLFCVESQDGLPLFAGVVNYP